MAPFRIYYGDGSTYEGKPEDAPRTNVQCIAVPKEPLICEKDIYLYIDGWQACTRIQAELLERKHGLGKGGVRAKLWGLWLSEDDYAAIKRRAQHDLEKYECT